MEKYKLLKDLPNAKAGEIFVIAVDIGALVRDHDQYSVLYSKEQLQENDILNPDKGWFEKIEEKKYGGRVPKRFDRYWYIDAEGYIQSAVWGNIDIHLTGADEKRFECGGAFWTEEEAEKELKRREAYVILKEDTNGFEPDWNNIDHLKYFIEYNYYDSKLGVHTTWGCKANGWGLYFATEDDAETSIENHRQEWLDYLGIEEKE